MLATRADLRAAGEWVPGRFCPFNRRKLRHVSYPLIAKGLAADLRISSLLSKTAGRVHVC